MSRQEQLTELDIVSFKQRGKAAGPGTCQSRGLSPPDGGRGSCLDLGGQAQCLQLSDRIQGFRDRAWHGRPPATPEDPTALLQLMCRASLPRGGGSPNHPRRPPSCPRALSGPVRAPSPTERPEQDSLGLPPPRTPKAMRATSPACRFSPGP